MDNTIKIVFTDLDGTLLNSEKEIGPANMDCLVQLGKKNVVRVIATGRSLYSFQKLFNNGLPADYLIFSCGAGLIDLRTNTLLRSSSLNRQDILFISSYLNHHQVDFMVHQIVPENHHFTFFHNSGSNADFMRRIELYEPFSQEFTTTNLPEKSAQIIAILPCNLSWFNEIKEGLATYQITRTTSPLDGKSIWMEIYPRNVSKGTSADWLCDYLDIPRHSTLGIGNDYNDISLLEYTEHSYVVANAPMELLRNFKTTHSNNDNGFYHATRNAMLQD